MRKLFFVAIAPFLVSYSSAPKQESESSPRYIQDYNAGIEAQKNQDYESAIDSYRKAVDQKGDFSDAWNNLGYCYRMVAKSNLAKSEDAYTKALKNSPNHEEALEYQGESFVMTGKLDAAYQNYLKLKQMGSKEAGDLKDTLDPVLKQAQKVLKTYQP